MVAKCVRWTYFIPCLIHGNMCCIWQKSINHSKFGETDVFQWTLLAISFVSCLKSPYFQFFSVTKNKYLMHKDKDYDSAFYTQCCSPRCVRVSVFYLNVGEKTCTIAWLHSEGRIGPQKLA
jgi:hypothetical protein